MRVVCPASTSEASAGHSAARTTTKKQPVERKRRTSARLREQGKQQAEASQKKHQKRKQAQSRPKTLTNVTLTKIYVGNLLPATSCDLLKRIFSNFGTVSSVMLHCSSGLAVSRVLIPRSSISARDRQYATVNFYEASAANEALMMNGAEINGEKIVVSFAPADMPEATRGVQAQAEDSAMSL